MALERCKGAITAAIGRDLTKEEAAYVNRNAFRFKKRIEAANGDADAIRSIMDEAGERGDSLLARAKRDAALSWRAQQNLKAQRGIEFAQGSPAKWLAGKFRGSVFDYPGAKNSLAVNVLREGNARAESIIAELQKNKLMEIADSTDYTVKSAVNNAKYALQNGADMADVAKQFGKGAAQVADIGIRHEEALREALNREGAWITKNSDRTFRRTYDPNKVAKADGFDYGSDQARAAFARDAYQHMNWDKAFDGEFATATEAERLKVLEKDFGEHVSGEHIDFSKEYGSGGKGRMGQRFSWQRRYVFNSPADDLAFQEKYGRTGSFLERWITDLRDGGKAVALMHELGPRPEDTLNRFVAEWTDELNDSDPKKARDLKAAFDSEMRGTWRLLTGPVGHPADNFVARALASVRHTTGVAATAKSIFALPNDMVLKAAQMAQYSSEWVHGSVMRQLAQFVRTTASLPDAEKKWVMAQFGSRWENAIRPLDPNLVDHPGFGAIERFNGIVSSTYGHSFWQNNFRTGSMVDDANIFAHDKDAPFEKAAYRNLMQRFGIGAKEWNVMRKLEMSTLADGREVLMPMHITDAPLAKFKPLVPNGGSDSLLSHARADLAAKYRNMIGELADRSTSAASLENQAAVGLTDINPNSIKGEALRAVMQLKGWGINYIRNHLDRELRGNYQQNVPVGKALRDMAMGQNNRALVGMSRMIAKGMVVAYVTYALSDLALGKTPVNPFDWDSDKYGGVAKTPGFEAATRAFGRQGLGLYTDWLVHESKPNESVADKLFEMAGPEIGFAGDAGDVALSLGRQAMKPGGMTDEQRDKDMSKLFGTVWRNIPGTQVWWGKAALDTLIFNEVSDALNPGYKDRLKQRAADRGQQFWLGP